MKQLFLALLLINSSVNAEECVITYDLLYAIAKKEGHPKREVGYPYIISFNNKKDKRFLKSSDKMLMIDSRTLDCNNKERCVHIANYLIAKKINNLDLGAFQLCYKWQKKRTRINGFFSLSESFRIAKEIGEENVKKFGCTWSALAHHHSFIPSKYKNYAQGLIHEYQKSN